MKKHDAQKITHIVCDKVKVALLKEDAGQEAQSTVDRLRLDMLKALENPDQFLFQHIGRAVVNDQKQWRCFHCDEVFTDSQKAMQHFGPKQCCTPACCISAETIRGMESQLSQFREEDTDLHREICRLKTEHNLALQRAEESGYAKGLKDAQNPL